MVSPPRAFMARGMKKAALSLAVLAACLCAPALSQSVTGPVIVDPAILRLQDQINALQRELQAVTSEKEQLVRERDTAAAEVKRLNRIVEDLLAKEAAASAPPPPPPPVMAPAPGFSPAPAPAQTGQLGTLPASALPGDAGEAFRRARALLLQGDFASAESAFTQFLAAYGDTSLAPEAKFWLGRTLVSRGANAQAAKVFIDMVRTHAAAPLAPDALIWAGAALRQDGASAQACAVLADVPRRYARLSPEQKALLDRERRAAQPCPA